MATSQSSQEAEVAVETIETIELRPQLGPQEAFLASDADIAIAGGAAGGGKTFALLMEPLYQLDNPHFGTVIFRRTYPQIMGQGALWDEAGQMYPLLGGEARDSSVEYRFRSGMTVKFAHMQHEKDRLAWKGAQIPMIGFDQLEDFTQEQFWFLLSRNRSARAGIRPYVRATCNPVPEDDPVGGWLNRFIRWWIDPETGYAIQERAGKVRWFVRLAEELHWADTPDQLHERFPEHAATEIRPRSVTFIPATLEDNPALERADPDYRAKLMALPLVERERLLKGNWHIKAKAGLVFNRAWLRELPAMPIDVEGWVRYWDKAGTVDNPSAAYSAGVLIGNRPDGSFVVGDVERGQWSALERERVIRQKAEADASLQAPVATWVEQEPGSGGKESAENTVRQLAGFDVHSERATGDKLTRAQPFAAQVEAGNVSYVQGPWNEPYLQEMHRFDGKAKPMDQVDASSGAFNRLTLQKPKPRARALGRPLGAR